jgi:DNA-binding NarL/FixJ family response regulator
MTDDSPEFLQAARTLLEREGIAVVGLASNSAEALRLIEELRPDFTLVDIDLGAESGFDLVRTLHDGSAKSRAILVSTYPEADFADLIEASPALGFIPKSDLSTEAIYAILNESRER